MNIQRKKWWFGIPAVVLFVLAVALFFFLPARGPSYGAKDIRDWFMDYRQFTKSGPEAAKAFKEMGAAAAPFLVARLNERDWEAWYMKHWQTMPAWISKRLPHPKNLNPKRDSALALLQMLGSASKGSTPELIRYYRQLQRQHLKQPKSGGMQQIEVGPPWSRVTTQVWHKTDEEVMNAIVRMLGSYGEGNPDALDVLIEALREPQLEWAAFSGLMPFAQRDLGVVARLDKELNNPEVAIRLGAAEILNRIGARAVMAVPKLKELVKESSEPQRRVRYLAAQALWNIDRQYYAILPYRMEQLKSNDEGVRWAAVSALEAYKVQSEPVIAALTEMLMSDGSNRVRGKAAITLGKIGPKAKAAVPALKKALVDEFSNVQEAAKEALAKIEIREVQ